MTRLEQLIQQFKIEMGADFISTDVVGMDGLSITGTSADPGFNGTDASARFSMVLKLAEKASARVNMGKLDDNLTTTDKDYILARLLGDGSYFWYVAVTRNATLGYVRLVMNEYTGQLWDAIPR